MAERALRGVEKGGGRRKKRREKDASPGIELNPGPFVW